MAKNSGHKIYGIFKAKYLENHGTAYLGSIYRDVGMLKRISDEIGEGTLAGVVEYYFNTRSRHEVSDICFNYSELINDMELAEKDRAKRALLRERTKRRIEELGIPLGIEPDGEDFDGEDFQYFVCEKCEEHWSRRKTRGRPPKTCEECRGS